jgi:hypothetical protein
MAEMTEAQIRHDNFLRQLGMTPRLAMAFWHKLGQGDRVVVVTYMMLWYDNAFARHFLAEANKRVHPESVIHITNSWEVTDARLRARGFRQQRTVGNVQIWADARGNEVWLLPRPNTSTPAPPAPWRRTPTSRRSNSTSRRRPTCATTCTGARRSCDG